MNKTQILHIIKLEQLVPNQPLQTIIVKKNRAGFRNRRSAGLFLRRKLGHKYRQTKSWLRQMTNHAKKRMTKLIT